MATPVCVPLELLDHITDYLDPKDLISLLFAFPKFANLLAYRRLSVTDRHQRTVLHLLADPEVGPDDPELRDMIVTHLIQYRAITVNIRDIYGYTPLWIAADRGNEEMVKLLLETKDLEPDIPSLSGVLPLGQAASRENEAIVKRLLAHRGVNPICEHSPDGQQVVLAPLATAAMAGRAAMVKLMLEHVPRENLEPAAAMAFKYAANFKHKDVMEVIINSVGNVNFQIEKGQSVLLYTYSRFYRGIAKQLLTKDGIDAGCKDNFGRTLLSIAVDREDIEMVKLLLARRDVEVVFKGSNGWTNLALCASNVYHPNNAFDNTNRMGDLYGRAALDYADDAERIELAELLTDVEVVFKNTLHSWAPSETEEPPLGNLT
ncbi:Ankyrin repeats 3 copy [Aspergillus parasiticus SU-1]|uniref:Ankyrin repeats 3 copy n=1 Tax=Aspergillus parasiticus (strain ATCC 56775 / NRRL 5862 / SRRC 143 / SU-1) TaxID=1403190 RepID=A0A0F0I3I4_ASPPU|nr:Ankyrin repeats 3 copy [Aspergillus parasiticus SU-1]